MEEQKLGSFDQLPAELLEFIFNNLTTAEAARLCATNNEFRELCEQTNFLEDLAHREVQERIPYRVWYGTALDQIKLLEHTQLTWYKVTRMRGGAQWILSLLRPGDVGNYADRIEVILHLPGTVLIPGKYWLFGSKHEWSNLRWYVFKTEEELNRRLSWYYNRGYGYDDEIRSFIDVFRAMGGVDGDQELISRDVGDPNSDTIDIHMIPVTFDGD